MVAYPSDTSTTRLKTMKTNLGKANQQNITLVSWFGEIFSNTGVEFTETKRSKHMEYIIESS